MAKRRKREQTQMTIIKIAAGVALGILLVPVLGAALFGAVAIDGKAGDANIVSRLLGTAAAEQSAPPVHPYAACIDRLKTAGLLQKYRCQPDGSLARQK